MEFFKELEKLNKIIIFPCFVLFLFLTFFFFAFGPKEVSFLGTNFFLPLPTWRSFSVLVFSIIQRDLVPVGVELIAINPLSAFLTQVIVSLSLAFVVGFPFFLYQFIKYLSPVFSKKEKYKIIKVWIPSLFLFIAGCLFAYFLLIPTSIRILYDFPVAMGITPFFVANEFIVFVLSLMLVSGLMFLLPIFMNLLSWLGIVEKNFWRNNWRYAAFIFLLFSAIITPDGSGITMLMFSLPLSCLYFLGYCLTLK